MIEQSKNIKKLTLQERKFFLAYVKGANITRAYLSIRPDVTEASAASLGTRMLQRIKKANFEELLDAGGLGLDRLSEEIEKGLNAEIVKHWQGEEIGTYADNGTRQRSRELLADLLNVRRQKVDVEHSGHIEASVVVYLPDNGRGKDGGD